MTPTHPPRFRRRVIRFGLALAAWGVVAGSVSVLLPDVPGTPQRTAIADGYAVGAVHMHTRRSDGSGTVDDIVQAAVDWDLDFIVVSDHNTEESTRYEYRQGVLVVLGEELTTLRGHVLMLDVNSVHVSEPDSTDRANGLPFHRTLDDAGIRFVSHPNGRRYWRDRTMHDVDGMEIWNADSEWRNDGVLDWLEALTLLPFRPQLGIMALVDRPDRNLALLDSVSVLRDVATTCAVDAHARIPITDDLLIPFPSYRMTLGLVQHHVRLVRPLTGDAALDGPTVTESLRRGEGYCALGGLGDDARVHVAAEDGELRVDVPEELDARIVVYRDGAVVAEHRAAQARVPLSDPGSYRVEVDVRARLLRRRWFPWILSAPIRVGPGPDDPPAEMLGEFEDDYGNRYDISPVSWEQGSDTRLEVREWRASQRYMVARAVSEAGGADGAWWRIDWLPLDDGSWSWAYCTSTWDASTYAGARSSQAADPSDPLTGCGGFPFSRMRRIP